MSWRGDDAAGLGLIATAACLGAVGDARPAGQDTVDGAGVDVAVLGLGGGQGRVDAVAAELGVCSPGPTAAGLGAGAPLIPTLMHARCAGCEGGRSAEITVPGFGEDAGGAAIGGGGDDGGVPGLGVDAACIGVAASIGPCRPGLLARDRGCFGRASLRVASLLLLLAVAVRACNTTISRYGSGITPAVLSATSACDGARAPILPGTKDAVDGAELVLAAIGLDERCLDALDAAILIVYKNGAGASDSTTTAGLVAAGPDRKRAVGAVDRAVVRVAHASVEKSRAANTGVLHVRDDGAEAGLVTTATADVTVAKRSPAGEDTINGTGLVVAVGGLGGLRAGGATEGRIGGNAAGASLGAGAASLGAGSEVAVVSKHAGNRAGMSVASNRLGDVGACNATPCHRSGDGASASLGAAGAACGGAAESA
jgi:hypothetical protein